MVRNAVRYVHADAGRSAEVRWGSMEYSAAGSNLDVVELAGVGKFHVELLLIKLQWDIILRRFLLASIQY